jgi:BDI_1685-like, C-terminal domain
MPELGEALRWAVSVGEGDARDRWLFQLGAWHAGRAEVDVALEVLTLSRDDRARALSGRLLRRYRKDAQAAVASFRSIQSEAISLHAQVIVERDLALAALGKETLEERAHWLDAVSALEDEWLIERRASLLMDQGRSEEARFLLTNTKFQLVHQRYTRTRLWCQIEQSLGLDPIEWPAWLGEDDMADFGAYREYPE